MILSSIKLQHFRNFSQQAFAFNPFLTIILGENARGKTNLLEAVYFSVNGSGFRESKEEELIQWDEEKALVETNWQEGEDKMLFQIQLQKKNEQVEKKFFINKAVKTHAQYREEQTYSVLFAPEQIQIITGSPDSRREYFNKVISIFDKEYKRRLTNYEHALRRRNKIYEHYHSDDMLMEELSFWNDYLVEQGNYISQKRQEYIDYLNKHSAVHDRAFEIEYLRNDFTLERWEKIFAEERKWRRTLIGPQKDDVVISLQEEGVKENVHAYGSRSEQRLAVFWLKLNEIRFFEEYFHKKPLLLLDDISSELDVKNKKLILDLVKQYQTILTTTEVELLDLPEMPKTVLRIGESDKI